MRMLILLKLSQFESDYKISAVGAHNHPIKKLRSFNITFYCQILTYLHSWYVKIKRLSRILYTNSFSSLLKLYSKGKIQKNTELLGMSYVCETYLSKFSVFLCGYLMS